MILFIIIWIITFDLAGALLKNSIPNKFFGHFRSLQPKELIIHDCKLYCVSSSIAEGSDDRKVCGSDYISLLSNDPCFRFSHLIAIPLNLVKRFQKLIKEKYPGIMVCIIQKKQSLKFRLELAELI